jgi:hypothetical protein
MNAWTHSESLSFLINFAINSLKVKSLKIEKKIKGKKVLVSERPQIHLLLHAPKGQLKSSMLKEISELQKIPIFTGLTFPALVGSIDKETKQVIPAGAWECRNNLLLLDEWNFKLHYEDETLKALLQLTESGQYSRKIARYAAPFETEKKELPLFFKVKDGNILVKTKFSLILATMYDLASRTQKDAEALVSRTIPYSYQLNRAELNSVSQGEQLLNLKPKENIPSEIIIKHEKYKKLLNFCDTATDANFLRTVGDISRAYAIYGWKPELFTFIIERKNTAENKLEAAKQKNAIRYAGLMQGQARKLDNV